MEDLGQSSLAGRGMAPFVFQAGTVEQSAAGEAGGRGHDSHLAHYGEAERALLLSDHHVRGRHKRLRMQGHARHPRAAR